MNPVAIRIACLCFAGLVVGCAESDPGCEETPPTLQITSPAGGATIVAGQSVQVAYSYNLFRTYDTLEVITDTTVCSVPLASQAATGTGSCAWNTNGLEPGDQSLRLRVTGTTSSAFCPTVRFSAPVTVSLQSAAPVVTRQPASVTVAEQSRATFDVAARGSGPFTYRWQRSIDGGVNFSDVVDGSAQAYTTPAAALTDDGSRFRTVIGNDVGSVTSDAAMLSVIAGTCPTPPRPAAYDTSAPPAPSGAASYGIELLNDPGFEGNVRVGFSPNGFGYWRADQSVTVGPQQGIVPRSGGLRMLHFVGTGRADNVRATASEQLQLVDVSALAADIDNDLVTVDASAWFSRVAGCVETDDGFGVAVIAFDGPPTTFSARYTNGQNAAIAQGLSRDAADVSGVDAWLRHRTASFRHNQAADRQGDVYGWRRAAVTMDLPRGTRFVAITVYANENVTNDADFPELHGHYADEASFVLSRR